MALALTLANLRGAHLRAISLWAAGSYLQVVAFLLYGLRGVAPDFASASLAFALLSAGYAFQLAAIVAFSQRVVRIAAMMAAFFVGVALHTAIYLLFPQAERWHIEIASFELAGWMAACSVALVLLAKPNMRVSYWITGASFALTAATNVYRAIDTIVGPSPTLTLLSVNLTQTITYGSMYVTLLGTSLGFILMAKERSDSDLVRAAANDSLTGLLNRRAFEEAARKELARAARTGDDLCAAMCDLDHFKDVNDTFGHPIGDRVLVEFAQILRAGLRPFDIVSRYGGEEFFVYLLGTDVDDALSIAERIRIAASWSRVPAGSGALVGCTASIGITRVRLPGDTVESIAKRADDALYAAKAAGRNCCRVL